MISNDIKHYFINVMQDETIFDQISSTLLNVSFTNNGDGECQTKVFDELKYKELNKSINNKCCEISDAVHVENKSQDGNFLFDEKPLEICIEKNDKVNNSLQIHVSVSNESNTDKCLGTAPDNIIDQEKKFIESTNFLKLDYLGTVKGSELIKSDLGDYLDFKYDMENPFNYFAEYLLFENKIRKPDIWIKDERIKFYLNLMNSYPLGTFSPSKDMLTLPGVILQDELTNPVLRFAEKYLEKEDIGRQKNSSADFVTQDFKGLYHLIKTDNYFAAINLTAHLLSMYGQGIGKIGELSKHTVHSILLWYVRLTLLCKVRQYSLAEDEAKPFGDFEKPDMYFEWYPELYGGKIGSLVPFGMRILVAAIPYFNNNALQSLNRLHNILLVTRKIQQNLQAECDDNNLSENEKNEYLLIWQKRELMTLQHMLNCAIITKVERL